MNQREELTLLDIQGLMMDTLAYKGSVLREDGFNFEKANYSATRDTLFNLMEILAIDSQMIDNEIKVRDIAWGAAKNLIENYNTNFSSREINLIYEVFHLLLSRGILSPGAVGNYGSDLPNFHVTEYGKKCLESKDILPYDSEAYIDKIKKIKDIDKWVVFYIEEALECFNANCYTSSLIMIGIASEEITNKLLDSYKCYLTKKDPKKELLKGFEKKIRNKKISQQYSIYEKSIKEDNDLKELNRDLDNIAKSVFYNYLRLTRNELAHPNQVRSDRITSLSIFISFINYCERQYKCINYFQK